MLVKGGAGVRPVATAIPESAANGLAGVVEFGRTTDAVSMATVMEVFSAAVELESWTDGVAVERGHFIVGQQMWADVLYIH